MTRLRLRDAGLALALAFALVLPAHASAEAAREQPSAPGNPWSLRLSAELGAGSRDVNLPEDGVAYRIRPGLFPVGGLGFELDHATSHAVSLGLHFRFQSSVPHGVVEQHTDGTGHPIDVRSQRLELAFAPAFRLDREGTWILSATAGYAFHNLRPEVHHLLTPAYSLSGPYLRPGLQLVLWDAVRLSLEPEVQWLAHVSRDLVDRGVAEHGLGVGGEAGVEVRLGARWAVRATYREMRFWLDSSQPQRFEDTARFVTARVSGRL